MTVDDIGSRLNIWPFVRPGNKGVAPEKESADHVVPGATASYMVYPTEVYILQDRSLPSRRLDHAKLTAQVDAMGPETHGGLKSCVVISRSIAEGAVCTARGHASGKPDARPGTETPLVRLPR